MLTIDKEPYGLGNPDVKGDYIRIGATPEEYAEHLKTIQVKGFGWLETDTKGLNLHFVGHADGLGAVMTSGVITAYDVRYLTKLCGEEATKLLTRHHNIRD